MKYFVLVIVIIVCIGQFCNVYSLNSHHRAKRIIGGTITDIQLHPYKVSIQYNTSCSHFCGGTIISSKAVLTAAHCFDPTDKANYFLVSSGSTCYKKGITGEIDKIITHPLYNETSEYDYAILIMVQRFQFSQYVRPARLPEAKFNISIGEAVITMGWGVTIAGNQTLPDLDENKLKNLYSQDESSSELRSVQLFITDRIKCKRSYPNISDNIICAAAPDKDSCDGDSGGPLMMLDSDILIGVITSGNECAHPDHPGLYGSVAAIVEWINKTVTDNQAL